MSRWRNRDKAFGQLVRDNHDLVRETHQLVRDNQVFMHDLLRKNDSVLRHLVVELRAGMSTMAAELRDLREESRAQREALLRLIDRLPPPADASAS